MPFAALESAYHFNGDRSSFVNPARSRRETNPSHVKHCFRDIKWREFKEIKEKMHKSLTKLRNAIIAAQFATCDLSVNH